MEKNVPVLLKNEKMTIYGQNFERQTTLELGEAYVVLYGEKFEAKKIKEYEDGNGHFFMNCELFLNDKKVANVNFDGWSSMYDYQYVKGGEDALEQAYKNVLKGSGVSLEEAEKRFFDFSSLVEIAILKRNLKNKMNRSKGKIGVIFVADKRSVVYYSYNRVGATGKEIAMSFSKTPNIEEKTFYVGYTNQNFDDFLLYHSLNVSRMYQLT